MTRLKSYESLINSSHGIPIDQSYYMLFSDKTPFYDVYFSMVFSK